jgi:uncharacterized protein (TIRG00374 family)
MKKKLLSLFQYLLFLGIGIFLVWWSIGKISDKDWKEVVGALAGANYLLTIPVAVALLIAHYSRAVRWKILMEPLGYRPSIINTYCAVLVGYLANLAVPRLGEVLKCTLLARYEKVPADKLVGTIVAERAFDIVCLLLVFLITIVTQVDIVGEFAGRLIRQIYTTSINKISLLAIIIIGVVLIGSVLLVRYLIRRFRHVRVVDKFAIVIKGILNGLTSVRYVKHKGWFLFHTVFIWTMYLLSVQIGMYAMNETSHFGIEPSLSVLSLGSIGMIVTQGGIGAYPILIQETMLLYGLTENVGKAFGWLLWLVQFVQMLIFGFLALAFLPYLNKNKKQHALHRDRPEENIQPAGNH